ncbi:MAG: serine/threonine protein kinase, partial [Planctomycetes bacterium]|nr:serine/threonine protein kinase [Planctomycetota bacterium]
MQPPPSSPSPSDSGSFGQLGAFQVLGRIGAGGMGEVWRARHPSMEGEVALKTLPPNEKHTASQVRRFLREANALARIQHPNVVAVREVGEANDVPYMALDLVPGISLQDRLTRQGPLEIGEVIDLGLGLCAALEAAHSLGIVHRDLKPDNVILSPNGPVLIDFGLVRELERLGETVRLTQSGATLGTPGYWPPEQLACSPDDLGPAADLYSLGATLYAALTGRPPIVAPTLPAAMIATRDRAPDPIERSGVPRALEALIFRCLEKEPQDRFASATALADALEAAAKPPPPLSLTPILIGLALVAVGLIVAISSVLLSRRVATETPPPTPSATASA